MSTQPKTLLTPEQYLEIERKAPYKSEYYNGEMFAMAGASLAHNMVAANVAYELRAKVRAAPCRILQSDMRVHVNSSGLYAYPDIVAVCAEARLADNQFDTLLNPNLIVEVLSPSTEAYDRGLKFELYQSIESLTEYLLVASDRVHADLFTRRPDGRWLLTAAKRLDDAIELQSLDCRIELAAAYDNVDFPAVIPPK